MRITASDVFAPEEARGSLLYGLANALHFTTHDAVIARELWFGPGDQVSAEEIGELERNLRRLDLFGAVDVAATPAGDHEIDVDIATRDRFSLAAGAGIAHVGGVTKFNFRVAESNLFGTGKQLVAVDTEQTDAFAHYLRYTDRQLFGTWHMLEAKVGETEEGAFANLDVLRPSHHLADPMTHGIQYRGVEEEIDYFQFGEVVAEVPQRSHALRAFAGRVSGPRELRATLGADARMTSADTEPAVGTNAGAVRVPGDADALEVGPYVTIEYRPRFDEARHIDAIDYVEDLPLGAGGSAWLAASWRREDGAGSDLRPRLELEGHAAVEALPGTYFTLAAQGAARFDTERLHGWQAGAALHAFQQSLPRQTLAMSLTVDVVGERQDLPRQLTLGEDNGLRGYPAHEFAGSRRVRFNLEDRIDTGIALWSVHFGVVPFLDVGWVHDPVAGLSLDDPIRGVGLGLRLGSSHLAGSRVVRLDVAWPLDDVGGHDYGPSVSIAVGQVFSFFGNASVLGTEF